ncbi:sulfate ABC transporter permease [Blochmannia endosymbiont of Polyrhachis (Hedomyrma) turneri]|uniref:sulfate ABC transporter permease n=1 Tax=Blochmannia endosymbiont of Polyrhachis (Hedomyrma) turneri TaxID=1505596 RepID=UPI00061A6425|nr:sulfate ABC transporter permease subunit [Blochmannia endosymbiont of Polyrhachis (Hedomyrma) turneri]AKC60072.1 Sulfate transport system permease protein CysW [Blochmannia endosymbiont of Polyrhachis (Hedomyrma) turneri]
MLNNFKNYIFLINWTKWILITFGILISALMLFIPLVFIFVTAFSEGLLVFKKNLLDCDMLHAIFLTVFIALLSLPINVVFGILLSWLVTRFSFRGRQLLLTLVNVPVAVSPVIAGFLYLLLYGYNTLIGGWLDSCNIQILFAWPGMVLVTVFVTFPIIVHEIVPVMFSIGKEEDEVAVLLGASGWKMFWYVTFRNIRWSLLHGVILSNARIIGEFGALSVVSGLIRGKTYTLSLQVELLYQDYNIVGAFVASLLLGCMAIFTLFVKCIARNYFTEAYLK